ncbi:efflux RND transporter periplasmic adaptor subunit [Actinokineospora enzanensis]|uniref:efflux RND transporter periplasmic adaptor subunit n=1 Tax=Actinokineospora enzanensis TaxID=155975 RepID=UPI000377C7F2|nr:efflux RND transporter periplasmic adaptor subunit [Actinokineospora enzanensis]
MNTRLILLGLFATAAVAGCTTSSASAPVPGLAERGTTMTTAALTRQDLSNKVSLKGTVTLNPVFGLVAPIDGEIRYLDVKDQKGTPTKPTRVGAVWVGGKPTHIEVPTGSTFSGRLVDDRAKVTAGMPVVSAKYGGYGIVADIGGEQAYALADGTGVVRVQIKSGPGPFDCAVLGTIAALPAGTIPPPPAPATPAAPVQGDPKALPTQMAPVPQPAEAPGEGREPSSATGMRLVCTAPPDIRLINGAEATVEVVTAQVKQALVAPVEAVAGRQGNGKVDVLGPDGARQTKDVVLGLTDGRVVEIKSGLAGTETLAVPGPSLPPAQAEPKEGYGK